MEPVLLIMAAGMGSRYGGNKQLDPVTAEGDIIMDFSLYGPRHRAGFRKAVFVIKRDMEDVFRRHLEVESGKAVRYEVRVPGTDGHPGRFRSAGRPRQAVGDRPRRLRR